MNKSPYFFLSFFIGFIFFLLFIYNFSYLFPFTNNAFVISNIRPVATSVDGTIDEIYVENGEFIKKGQPLLKINQQPYLYEYLKAKNDVITAKLYLKTLHEQSQILVQESKINSFILNEKIAKLRFDATIVYAENDGYVHNLFFDRGTPVKAFEPFFAFISADSLFVQANMSELDLRRIKPKQKVTIIPRMYVGSKIYHGEVMSKNWTSSRQVTDTRNQAQIVTNNEDNWVLLPQRFPVMIKVTDYDPKNFPLNVGNSVYVYIHQD
jgi:multidrug efflux system membrane fusion protein